MQQAPNRLGSVLGYFSNAYRYAFVVKADQRALAFSLLSAVSRTTRYNQLESIDTGQAMRLAVTSAWVYSGIKTIADRTAASDARPSMKRRVGEELRDQPNHPFNKLLDSPNPFMTWEFIARYITWWAFLSGNAYIFVATAEVGVGEPEELWPLPSDAIEPDPKSIHISATTGRPVINFNYTVDGKVTTLPGENVIHIRFPNPFDYWVGLSPLTALIEAVRTDRFQSKYLQGYYGRDNAIPTAIISVPPETNDIDFETIKEQIRDQFGEGRRSAITRGGDLTVQTISQTMRDMEIMAARKFNREEVNHVLGIPEGLIDGGGSGDSRLATEITFARITTQPFLDLVASEASTTLAPLYGPGYVVKAPSIIPQDRALALQEYEKYAPDRSINENRKVLALPPLDIPGVMATINAIRTKAGLDEINTPLDSVILDLMLSVPTRLIPVLSSNTFANASSTGLRVGQKDASGEEVPEPMQLMGPTGQTGGDSGSDGSPAAGQDATNTSPGGANLEKSPKTPSLIGAEGGARMVQVNAGKSAPPWVLESLIAGQKAELTRWKKVAVKMAKQNEDPASYLFETKVLPEPIIDSVRKNLASASERECEIVFSTAIDSLQFIGVLQ